MSAVYYVSFVNAAAAANELMSLSFFVLAVTRLYLGIVPINSKKMTFLGEKYLLVSVISFVLGIIVTLNHISETQSPFIFYAVADQTAVVILLCFAYLRTYRKPDTHKCDEQE